MNTQRATIKNVPTANFFETDFTTFYDIEDFLKLSMLSILLFL